MNNTVVDRTADLIGEATAEFSPCRTYRYALTRTWDASRPPLAFGMLNPSKADAFIVDPTVRRCIGFAQRLRAGGLLIFNAHGLRSTDPRALLTHPDPIGPDNDRVIIERLRATVAGVVVAWGTQCSPERAAAVLGLIREAGHRPVCLGLTKNGAPRHPLYVAKTAPVTPYPDPPSAPLTPGGDGAT